MPQALPRAARLRGMRACARPRGRVVRGGDLGINAKLRATGGGGALRYHGLMHLFSFSALEHGGASRGFHAPSAIIFGVQGCACTPFFPVPVGNTGTDF